MEYKINTQLPITFEKIENPPYLNDSRFQAVRCYIAHEKDNYNGSWFDLSVLEKMGQNMAGVPIVGYISIDNANTKDYNGHEQKLTVQNGEISIEYLGRAYGCVISNDDVEIVQRMHESGEMRAYLSTTGILWKMFTDSIEIFDRDISKPHSMELEEDSIVGNFEKDGYFHFTDCKVRALCILGTGISPAMSNSVIEKFSIVNQEDNIREMLSEINNSIKQFSLKNQSPLGVDDINIYTTEEGGKTTLDEKLELLTKYNFTLETILFSIEELSLEEIETKILDQFALLASQKQEEIANALRVEQYTDRWGDKCTVYSYVDSTDTEVFAYDRQDNWNLCGFMYSMNGDSVIVDFESKKRKKFEIVDFVEGVQNQFSLFPQEALDYEVASKEKELTEQFSKVNEGVETAEQIAEKFTALELEKQEIQTQLDTATTNFNTISAEFELAKPELTRLKDFETTTLSTQRTQAEEAIFSQFEQLAENEEFQALKSNASQFTLEQLEEKSALILVKSGTNIKFTAKPNKSKSQTVKLGLNRQNQDEPDSKPYGNLFEKYLPKEE